MCTCPWSTNLKLQSRCPSRISKCVSVQNAFLTGSSVSCITLYHPYSCVSVCLSPHFAVKDWRGVSLYASEAHTRALYGGMKQHTKTEIRRVVQISTVWIVSIPWTETKKRLNGYSCSPLRQNARMVRIQTYWIYFNYIWYSNVRSVFVDTKFSLHRTTHPT